MNAAREPLAIRALIVAVVNVLVVFGIVRFTDAQVDAIVIALDSIISLLVTVLWVRPAVTPVADPSIPGHVVVSDEDY